MRKETRARESWRWWVKSIKQKFKAHTSDLSQRFEHSFRLVFVSNSSLSSCKPGQLQANVPIHDENSKRKPIFRIDSKNQLSLTFHSFVENYWYWDVNSNQELNYFAWTIYFLKRRRLLNINHKFSIASPWSLSNVIVQCFFSFLSWLYWRRLSFTSLFQLQVSLLISASLLILSGIQIGCISTGASKLILQSKGKNNGGYSSRSNPWPCC